MIRSNVRRSALSPTTLHGSAVANTLRGLADLAERGDIIGAVVITLSPDRKRGQYVSGILKKSIPLAHYVTSRMKETLLHLKDEE